ncbi:multidrug efflux SMR transporter [Alcaligenaceae bacterium]|nr:multidrug efflux SMR transporter [Alcaligenaceae bacterium]
MSWIYLAVAIAAEIVATTALKASDGFTRLYPSLLTVVGYSLSFYCLAIALRVIPVGVAYAVWSGVGIVAISLIGYLLFKQALDTAGLIGIGLIVAGVVVLNVFSKAGGH